MSERYREARRQEITRAARRCFARDGFAGTSMSDVFAESGLSSGAVYSYFTSKDELVSVIIDEILAEVGRTLTPALDDRPLEPLTQVLRRFLHVLQSSLTDDLPGLAVQVWAEAQRNDTLRARLADDHRRVRHHFTCLLEHYVAQGAIPHGAPIAEMAETLTAIGPAFLVQNALLNDLDPERLMTGFEGLVAAHLGSE
ncbi:TetR/AcrR family transcriptional regulator [Saccharopolyspora shandongensis]|uniref:TetR/AcrR family transcriptional regulator n=1 Tax=Saccharopolyspora shandongensis TaxID=418495 RepID=UPI003448A46B